MCGLEPNTPNPKLVCGTQPLCAAAQVVRDGSPDNAAVIALCPAMAHAVLATLILLGIPGNPLRNATKLERNQSHEWKLLLKRTGVAELDGNLTVNVPLTGSADKNLVKTVKATEKSQPIQNINLKTAYTVTLRLAVKHLLCWGQTTGTIVQDEAHGVLPQWHAELTTAVISAGAIADVAAAPEKVWLALVKMGKELPVPFLSGEAKGKPETTTTTRPSGGKGKGTAVSSSSSTAARNLNNISALLHVRPASSSSLSSSDEAYGGPGSSAPTSSAGTGTGKGKKKRTLSTAKHVALSTETPTDQARYSKRKGSFSDSETKATKAKSKARKHARGDDAGSLSYAYTHASSSTTLVQAQVRDDDKDKGKNKVEDGNLDKGKNKVEDGDLNLDKGKNKVEDGNLILRTDPPSREARAQLKVAYREMLHKFMQNPSAFSGKERAELKEKRDEYKRQCAS